MKKHIIQKLSITFQSLHKYLVGSIWVEIKKLDEKLYKIHQISFWIFIKIIKKLYCSQLSFRPMGETRPTAHSTRPHGLAAQQPANGPPLRPVLGSRLGLIKPSYCRSPLAVDRDGRPSALLGRTKPAAAGTPCNPSSISSPFPWISCTHKGGGGGAPVAGVPAGDGEVERHPAQKPSAISSSSIISHTFSSALIPVSFPIGEIQRAGGHGGRRPWPAVPTTVRSAPRHAAEANTPPFFLSYPSPSSLASQKQDPESILRPWRPGGG
jgi:hypothetical protein